MTGDERDRILGLLSAGPATVARLAAGLGLPGGVVSYQLKLLEQQGLARVGTMRGDDGATTGVWVSTAAAAPPPLRIPAPLPGLTWTGDDLYPIPVWTAPHPAFPSAAPDGTVHGPEAGDPVPASGSGAPDSAGSITARPGVGDIDTADLAQDATFWAGDDADPAQAGPGSTGRWLTGAGRASAEGIGRAGEGTVRASGERAGSRPSTLLSGRRPPEPGRATWPPQPRRPDQATAAQARSPRLLDVRRVPVDDATFYEFARRLDALAREFAARATPGAPVTELTIGLSRPAGDGTAGYGS